MNREVARYRAVTTKRYGLSAGHAIQVDFLAYLREIRRERQTGARDAGPVGRIGSSLRYQ
jgi:hypothetical protein